MEFSFTDAFGLAFQVLKEKFVKVFIVFLLIIGYTIPFYLTFINNMNQVIKQLENINPKNISYFSLMGDLFGEWFPLAALILMIGGTLTSCYLISLVQSTLNQTKESFKSIFRRIGYYFGGSIILSLCLFLPIFLIVIVTLILPLFGLLFMLCYFIFIIYFIGYYRFIPTYCFITRDFNGMFSEIKRMLSGKFFHSIAIVILFYLINVIINSTSNNLPTEMFQTKQTILLTSTMMITYIVIQILSIGITLYNSLVDASFISLAIKADRVIYQAYTNKLVNEESKQLVQEQDDYTPFNL